MAERENAASTASYGLIAAFESAEALKEAAKHARQAGYGRLEAYGPIPCETVESALGRRDMAVPLISLVCGITGALAAYGMQYYAAVIDFPFVVGGKPFHSWPAFLPLTFEIGILGAVLGAAIGMLALNGFPEPYHPVFDVPEFERVSLDRFFLCIRAEDDSFDPRAARGLLESLNPLSVSEVSA